MNNRLPYMGLPPPVPGNTSFFATYPPPTMSFNPATPPPVLSPNSSNQGQFINKRYNTQPQPWKQQYRPYSVPNKPYHKRQNYQRINPASLYTSNSSGIWPNQHPLNNISDNLQKSSNTDSTDKPISQEDLIPGTIVTKKKRKPMSKYHQTKRWNEKDAEKALQAEKDCATLMTTQSLIIRFPDPPVNKDMVKEFHNDIENVHFPQAFTPRYCYIHLKEGSKVDEVVKKIEETPFGSGFLKAELKNNKEENKVVTIHDIDPYALYVGNLPMNVTKAKVMQYFSTCSRIDIGYPKQMKNSRYAIVGYQNVDEAIEAYKKTVHTLIDSRSMIVRFLRRNKSNTSPEEKTQNSQTTSKTVDESPSKNSSICDQSEKSETSTYISPDLSRVKDEPKDYEDEDTDHYEDNEDMNEDVKPDVNELNKRISFNNNPPNINPLPSSNSILLTSEIKKEKEPSHINEDEVDDEDDHEEYDIKNDNFSIANENCLEDDFEDDYEDDDDYDVDDEDMCVNMNVTNNYFPGDDDDDFL